MNPINVLIMLALLATAAALAVGVVSMVRGGEFDRAHATQFMSARVGLQAITVILLLIALFVA